MPKFTKGSKAASLAGKLGAAKTNAARKLKTTKNPVKNYYLLVDKSPSIQQYGLESAVRRAIDEQIASFKKAGPNTFVTISQFSTGFEPGKQASAADTVAPSYIANGNGTAIRDALYHTMEQCNLQNQSVDYATFIIVITDGEENSSRTSQSVVAKKIHDLIGTDRYTFVGIGPKGCESFFTNIGFPAGNILTWEQTVRGATTMSYTLDTANHVTATEVNLTQVRSSMNYFTPNLATLKTKTVKAELTNRSKDFKPWTVDKEVDIKTFVESHNVSFVLGAGYYPLTKPEKVQKSKQIVLVKKGTKEVYAGAEARELLGLPDEDTKVMPGNHGDWDIYVQSTSHNRKLVRGTKLLWDLTHTVDSKHTWADPSK